MSENKIKIIVSAVAAAVTVLIITLFIVICFQLVKISALKKEEATKKAQLESLIARSSNIEELKRYFEENKIFVSEEYVRNLLGWGKDGETIYKPNN